jgi:hypothetical protein
MTLEISTQKLNLIYALNSVQAIEELEEVLDQILVYWSEDREPPKPQPPSHKTRLNCIILPPRVVPRLTLEGEGYD